MSHPSLRESLLRSFLDRVWSAGKINAADSFLADAYTIHHDPGDPWEGMTLDRAAFKERVTVSRAPFPDQRFDVQALFEDGPAVAVTWLWSATHLGDLPGLPASGRRVTMSGATVYSFTASDRLEGHWQVVDRLGLYRQLREAA